MKEGSKILGCFAKSGYVIACTVLYIFALWIIGASIYSIYTDVMQSTFSVYNLLDEVGLLVFSIAVIDVSKYLLEEEVLKSGQKRRNPYEERLALTKFVIIIATALALEGLVLTIEVAKTDLERMVYPILLLLTSAIFILSIGFYQKMNARAEKE